MENLKEAVARGAALLDSRESGWAAKIDLEELCLSDCVQCVLGQLYGDYCTGQARLSLFGETAFGNGFSLPNCESCEESWTSLNDLWLEEIAKRKDGN